MTEEKHVLEYINDSSKAPHDSLKFSKEFNIPHATTVGFIKKLEMRNMIISKILSIKEVSCSEEGKNYVNLGISPERMVLETVAAAGEAGLGKKDLGVSIECETFL